MAIARNTRVSFLWKTQRGDYTLIGTVVSETKTICGRPHNVVQFDNNPRTGEPFPSPMTVPTDELIEIASDRCLCGAKSVLTKDGRNWCLACQRDDDRRASRNYGR